MDPIILIGCILFGISILIFMINTRVNYGFFTRYRSRSKGWLVISTLLLIIGLAIIALKAYLNGQLN